MLKSIELSGFKSFADRTRLEFADGISALVGPNGSGKSNIVDAIKWVLGEQSVKKLRGSEMTDVIFNGAAGRAPLGAAEVTLTFDNARRTFDLDVPEIHITRRIYRSGEGEYLLNRTPSRLKDIKDLLSGTGLGSQAYSIIEQGRVESLLQSSGVQRRAIFEEAAGVSRFHAKKLEIERRHDRVEQTILRLTDIVAEVENQLRAAKSQAGKAQQYRRLAERLKRVRIEAGLIEWRMRHARRERLGEEIETGSRSEAALAAVVEELETKYRGYDTEIEQLDRDMRKTEGEVAAVRERILGAESTITLQKAQAAELESEIARHGKRLVELSTKSVDSEELMRKSIEEIERARTAFEETSATYNVSVAQADAAAAASTKIRTEKEETVLRLEGANRSLSRLGGEIGGATARIETLANARTRNGKRLAEATARSEELEERFAACRRGLDDAQFKVARCREELDETKRVREERLTEVESHVQELSRHQQRQSALRERIALIEELLRKHEGLSPGVREVLRLSREPDSLFRAVHGLVADILHVEVDAAALIELALGPKTQQIVVSPEPKLFRYIEQNSHAFPGRVGFIWLDAHPEDGPWNKPDEGFSGRRGVHGRADRFVKTDPRYVPLAHRLLGRTWIVDTLATAKALYKESDDRTNFLTVAGELLEADGTLVVGPPHTGSGLISRRSEARTLAEQLATLETEIGRRDVELAVARNRLQEDERLLDESTREHQKALAELQTRRQKIAVAQERRKQGLAQREQVFEEGKSLENQHAAALTELESLGANRAERERAIRDDELLLARQSDEFERLERERREKARTVTNAKIELAKCEERLDFLKERIRQYESHQQERKNMLAEHRDRLGALKRRREQVELAILHGEAATAGMYLLKEERMRESAIAARRRRACAEQRDEIRAELKKNQAELNRERTNLHANRLERERLEQERRAQLERTIEDDGVDLAELDAEVRSEEERIAHESSREESHALEAPPKPGGAEAAENPDILAFSRDGGDVEDVETDSVPLARTLALALAAPDRKEAKELQKEAGELRAKIAKIGNVNLESLETLDELETRRNNYTARLHDVREAKKLVEKAVEKLNLDSQRIFEETFEGVREHFRDLFRRLFGGGHADLVFEDESDPLASGIDIVARPPGKELKSVTLLSGGEKTLTCVALLLAFFRFRPNPVCILDECDAALDEGNIDRFVKVIRDFRTSTQFLLVTHSKKTMACATTMYGVTMQESGVSKPISVRFVDVGENGEILSAGDIAKRPPRPKSGTETFSVDTPDAA